jgi:hypothetical protein
MIHLVPTCCGCRHGKDIRMASDMEMWLGCAEECHGKRKDKGKKGETQDR